MIWAINATPKKCPGFKRLPRLSSKTSMLHLKCASSVHGPVKNSRLLEHLERLSQDGGLLAGLEATVDVTYSRRNHFTYSGFYPGFQFYLFVIPPMEEGIFCSFCVVFGFLGYNAGTMAFRSGGEVRVTVGSSSPKSILCMPLRWIAASVPFANRTQ